MSSPALAGERLARTRRLLGDDGLHRLAGARVLVAGCGGVGGAAAITLARLGVGAFALADPGRFDPPDLNRQWGALRSTLGRNKAEVYAEQLRDIDPAVRAAVHADGVTEANVDALPAGADVVVDCLDVTVPLGLRARLYAAARDAGALTISAPVLGFGTLIAASSADAAPMTAFIDLLGAVLASGRLPTAFARLFAPASIAAIDRDLGTGRVPSVAIGPLVGAAYVATEAVAAILGAAFAGHEPIRLPRVLAVDAWSSRQRLVDIAELAP